MKAYLWRGHTPVDALEIPERPPPVLRRLAVPNWRELWNQDDDHEVPQERYRLSQVLGVTAHYEYQATESQEDA